MKAVACIDNLETNRQVIFFITSKSSFLFEIVSMLNPILNVLAPFIDVYMNENISCMYLIIPYLLHWDVL